MACILKRCPMMEMKCEGCNYNWVFEDGTDEKESN